MPGRHAVGAEGPQPVAVDHHRGDRLGDDPAHLGGAVVAEAGADDEARNRSAPVEHLVGPAVLGRASVPTTSIGAPAAAASHARASDSRT